MDLFIQDKRNNFVNAYKTYVLLLLLWFLYHFTIAYTCYLTINFCHNHHYPKNMDRLSDACLLSPDNLSCFTSMFCFFSHCKKQAVVWAKFLVEQQMKKNLKFKIWIITVSFLAAARGTSYLLLETCLWCLYFYSTLFEIYKTWYNLFTPSACKYAASLWPDLGAERPHICVQ